MKYIKKMSKRKYVRIFFLEGALVFLIFSFSFPLVLKSLEADVGENATMISNMTIGKSNPNIISIDIEGGSVVLVPNSTKLVNCSVIIEDYDGDLDLNLVNATFFDTSVSSKDATDSNSSHYTNSSCFINTSYGNNYQAKVDCFFNVYYYANPGSWNCSVYVDDLSSYTDEDAWSTTIEDLLAVGVPDRIDYGIVNATYVSEERVANVTNVGNVKINLSLSGYGLVEEDGYAMVCDYGTSQNITVGFEKYNITNSNAGSITYGQFENNYSNLTSSPFINDLSLDYQKVAGVNTQINTTYWRTYVPPGVAGTCNGTIVFGAIQGVAD